MRKRLLASILCVCLLVGLLPTVALAEEPVTLDISQGSIVITKNGYKVGEEEETPWGNNNSNHALTITGTVDGGSETDTETNMIDIQGGNPIITLEDISISMSSTTVQSAADRCRPPVLLRDDQTATIVLKGTNNLTGAELAPGILICKGATLTIEGDGTLNATGRGNTDGIGAGRKASNDKYGTPDGGNLVIKGGIINAKGNAKSGGIGSSNDKTFASITIQGGVITTLSGSNYSLWADSVTISGGTLLSLHKQILPDGLTITGGNVGNSYTGDISGRTRTALVCFDEGGNRASGTEVTITEGGAPAWTALTDTNGVITTYLADGTEKITAKVGNGEAKEVIIADGRGVVGPDCTCIDGSGTLTMTTPSQSLTTVDGTATLSGLAATYDASDSCVLPEGFHGAYETNISFEITKVVKNGQYMVVDQYAKIDGDTLTVYGETNQDAYTVYVRAVSGPDDGTGKKAYSDEIAISVNTYVSEAQADELDIAEGSIIITEIGYTQGKNTVNWSDSSHTLTITGTVDGGSGAGTLTNMIDIQGGNPIITLKDISISMSSSMDQSAKDRYRPPVLLRENQSATIVLEGTNNLTGAEQAPGIQINKDAVLTIEGDGTLNATARGTCDGIGTGREKNKGYGEDVSSGSLVIKSGIINVTGSGKCNAAIGTGYVGATGEFAKIEIQGGIITTSGGSNSLRATNVTISGGTLLDLHAAIAATTISVTGGNIGNNEVAVSSDRELTKLYFVDSTGTPKADMEVSVTEGDGPSWTALTDENGVITTYLANTTENIKVSYDNVSDEVVDLSTSAQALIGGTCSCSTFSDITWETGLPESITLHDLKDENENPVNMDYTVPAAQLVIDQPCDMPIHPSLPTIAYELSVVKDGKPVGEDVLNQYAKFADYHLTLLPGNAPYTVTLTAKVGDESVSDSITVNKGDATGDEISTINLSLGDAEIRYTEEGGYTYTQGTTIDAGITGTILITGFSDDGSVTVMGGSPTLIINQNDPGDVWTIYDSDAEEITLKPRSFNDKLRFGTVGSTMPELSYVSAAPKLKLNPDQGDITFNADGSVTQGAFTITALKADEEIAVWGADLEGVRTVTNSTDEELIVKINGENVALAAGGAHTISRAQYANQNETNPTTKTYIFDNGGTYSLIAVGEGDASAPALANEEQKKIKTALLDDDFSGTLYAGGFLFYVGLSELHAEQFSNVEVYTSTLGHIYLGAGLTDLTWGDYCATTGFTVDEENPNFVVDKSGVLYSKDYTTLYVIPSRLKGDYTINEACTTVNTSATMMIALDSLTLGKNVSSVTGGSGRYVFFANNLKAINVEAGNPYFASKDGILYSKDMTTILACPKNIRLPDNTLEIPETVTAVEEYIFSSANIQKLVIPEGANISSGRGLYRMTGLTEIQLLGSYGGTIAESDGYRMDQLSKVTVRDGFNFAGNTFDHSSMEWISSAGITVTGGDTPYDGQAHSVTVTAADGLTVEYLQADGNWGTTVPSYTAPGTYKVEWRITKAADYVAATEDTPASGFDFARELYSSRTFTITELEADESWFTLTAVKPSDAEEGFSPVALNKPAAAPSLEDGYTVKYSEDGTGEATAAVPTEAGKYQVTVEVTKEGYAKETLTLGYYTILSAEQSGSNVLSFVTNGGTTIEPIIETANEGITAPGDPTREGYTFAGWYSDVTLRNKVEVPSQMPSESATYYAKWVRENYTITYDIGEGAEDPGNPVSYHVETPTFTLLAPTKPGYQFTGWTWDGQTEPQTVVIVSKGSTGARAYTAHWEMITYAITYPNSCDQVEGNPISYTVDDTGNATIPLTAPVRDGYTFAGWTMVVDSVSYLLPATGAAIPQGTLGNITLTGIWMVDEQVLTLDANGGKFSDDSEFMTITADYASDINLSDITPTRSGYTFAGWYTDESCTTPFTGGTMPLTMTIYAKWTYISSGSSGRYAVSAADTENGTVTISHRNAVKGTTVTVTVTPDDGYVLKSLVVADAEDNALQLNDLGKGVYTFKMPEDKVTVTAVFEENTEMPTGPFVDVSADAYYYDAVLWAVEKGITNGTNAAGTTFSPDVEVSRAQMVTFLWRAHGAPKANGANPFTDVSESDYYYDAVLWAVANGVTKGTSATTFSPDMDVTRAQAVTFQWRAAGASEASGSSFDDVAADTWYTDAVTWAVANEITNGTGGNRFSPDVVVSRAQAVTFLYRELA